MKVHARKITAVVLTMALVATGATVPFNGSFSDENYSYAATTFTDIKGHWAESIINEAAGLGIVSGYDDGTFKPDAYINRQEFFKLLTGIMTVKPDTAKTEIKFPDVVAGEWYVPTIKTAVAAGITSGYEDGSFGINRLMSRQESAKVAASVVQTTDIPTSAVGVVTATDKGQIAEWAYSSVDTMFKKKYMKGDDFGNFQPTNALKRAEATTILLNMKENEKIIAANANKIAEEQEIANQPNACKSVHGTTGAGVFLIGQGSKADPYQLTTEENLNHIRSHTSEAAFYVLKNDIKVTKDFATVVPAASSDDDNWSAGNFQPIGTMANPFKGNLDGGDYTISGIKITGISKASGDNSPANYAGMFGSLATNSSVTDLKIDKSDITGNLYTGGIVGYSEGLVKNCQTLSGTVVTGNNNTGGLVGYSKTPLDSLRNQGNVTGKSSNTGGIVGSIVAPGVALKNCKNDGAVKGSERTGGVVGTFTSSPTDSSSIEECYNNGTVTAGQYNAGGIAGVASGNNFTVTIKDCENTGNISGKGVNGGIAGFLEKEKANVTNCSNEGDIEGSAAGGIAGNNEGNVVYSHNTGTIKGEIDGGGIVGYQQSSDSRISKCYNEGDVSSKSFAAGIVGESTGKVDNSYNAGEIEGTNSIGGIVGKNMGTVTNVYGAGTVKGSNGQGSLVGRNVGTLSNSFWLEDSCSAAIGLSDGNSSQPLVKKVTEGELRGDTTIKTSDGERKIVEIMNANNKTKTNTMNKTEADAVWEYTGGSYDYPKIIEN